MYKFTEVEIESESWHHLWDEKSNYYKNPNYET